MKSLVIAVNLTNSIINFWGFIILSNHQSEPHAIIKVTSDDRITRYQPRVILLCISLIDLMFVCLSMANMLSAKKSHPYLRIF